MAKKYYAIKVGKNVKDKIVRDWEHCKELVYGYPSIYKSFKTENEAIEYLNSIKDKDINTLKDKVSCSIASAKKKKNTTKAITFRVPTEVYQSFNSKINNGGYNKDKILLEIIKEWIE